MPQSSNTGPYDIGSPFTLPLFDSIPPIPLADTSPPFCINPPSTPQAPSTTLPSPAGDMPSPASYYIPPALPTQSPPPSPTSQGSTPVPSIPGSTPGPPMISGSPPVTILSPPYYYFPAPPSGGLSPPVFLPPVVFPAPMTPPPQNTGPSISLWCVAKPSVPDPIIQEAMNYACGSGADCTSIQPDGTCFEPNTLYAHASYAFNSYWQRTKVAGGTCSFGGTAILVTVDPSEFFEPRCICFCSFIHVIDLHDSAGQEYLTASPIIALWSFGRLWWVPFCVLLAGPLLGEGRGLRQIYWFY